jgi:hypothetical protein
MCLRRKFLQQAPTPWKIPFQIFFFNHRFSFSFADSKSISSFVRARVQDMPALVAYKSGRAFPYHWPHSSGLVIGWLEKLNGPPAVPLRSETEVLAFLNQTDDETNQSHQASNETDSKNSKSSKKKKKTPAGGSVRVRRPEGSTVVVGFFGEPEGMEEEEYGEFLEASLALQARADVLIGVVTSREIAAKFKHHQLDWVDRTPALSLHRAGKAKYRPTNYIYSFHLFFKIFLFTYLFIFFDFK